MVVVADVLFTATAIVLQPITGVALAALEGQPLTQAWILLSLALYVFAGVFWLPVVWMQLRMRDLARAAAAAGEPLPPPITGSTGSGSPSASPPSPRCWPSSG